jgi:hypothetical protein
MTITSFGAWAEVVKEIHDLKPGEFTSHPERSPKGPVAVVVSLPEQRAHVYRNGVRIGVSTCSTGKPGHETPTGVFTVLEKDKDHHSKTYNNAPMPNMNRLTWDGVALHAGQLPGYPASHGCVRLPMGFSERLWTVTHVGTPVIIAGSHSDPWELTHPGLVLGAYAEDEFEQAVAALDGKRHPSDWNDAAEYPVTTVIASTADRKIDLIENGNVVTQGSLSIKGPGTSLGSHVFILKGTHAGAKGLAWKAIGHHEKAGLVPAGGTGSEGSVITRLQSDATFQRALAKRMHPGMVMVVTDTPLHPDRRSGKDFVIMASS